MLLFFFFLPLDFKIYIIWLLSSDSKLLLKSSSFSIVISSGSSNLNIFKDDISSLDISNCL